MFFPFSFIHIRILFSKASDVFFWKIIDVVIFCIKLIKLLFEINMIDIYLYLKFALSHNDNQLKFRKFCTLHIIKLNIHVYEFFMNTLYFNDMLRNGSTRYNIRKETVWKNCILFGYCSVFLVLFFKQLCGNFKKRKNGFENTNSNKKATSNEREKSRNKSHQNWQSCAWIQEYFTGKFSVLCCFLWCFFTHFPTHYYYKLFFLFNTH